ncbi:MAG: GlsB/YeaQ/YmgE family stress response membrane protein [Anaerolineales bacterium]
MVFLDFVLILLIAALAGGIGRLLAGYYPGGLLASILIGFVGALLGTWLARLLLLPAWLTFTVGGTTFPFLWAVIGSTILLLLLSLIAGRPAV